MVCSMTGYGQSDFTVGEARCSIEVKSVNHRYLDAKIRMPSRFLPLENRVKDELKKRFSRGAFSVYVNVIEGSMDEKVLNTDIVGAYLGAEAELKERFGLQGKLDVSFVLGLNNIFSPASVEVDLEMEWEGLSGGLEGALTLLAEMRRTEGVEMGRDIAQRLDAVEGLLLSVEKAAPGLVDDYREKLKKKIEELLGSVVDEARVVTEAAVFAERTDITEEVVRFKSHLERMRQYLSLDEPVGRRCDFLCQELLREANTTASKAPDVGIKHTVVEIKAEIEKVREQIQNIE